VQKTLFQKSNLKLSDEKSLPKHVAIILHDRDLVNRASPEVVEDNGAHPPENYLQKIVETSIETSISHLTLICPNAQNLAGLKDKSSNQDLFAYLVGSDPQWLVDHAICLSYLGNRNDLRPETLLLLKQLKNRAPENQTLRLTITAGYDGRQSIISAVRKIAILVKSGAIAPDDISPELIGTHLHPTGLEYCNSGPDPDLIIMVGGVKRLDNSFLWQSAYSEFVFADASWPDFTAEHFCGALNEFMGRERRFGGLIDAK